MDEMVKSIIDVGRLNVLFEKSIRADINVSAILSAALLRIGADVQAGSYFSPSLLTDNLQSIRQTLRSEQVSNLIACWLKRTDSMPFLRDTSNLRPETERLYSEALMSGGAAEKVELVAALLAKLKDLPVAIWVSSIGRTDFETLVLQLADIAGPAWIPIEAANALLQEKSALGGPSA
jgi:hypothetical protein